MNLTSDQQNLLDKLPLEPLGSADLRMNPYTKISHPLEPLAISLYDFIVGAEGIGAPDFMGQYTNVHYKGHTMPMSLWHEARYLFGDLWPDEYMDLID